MEYSEWNITLQSHVIKLVAVYRPPSSTALYVPSSLFFEEFSIYLESVVTSTELLLISGDFNFHLDSAEDNNTKKFCWKHLVSLNKLLFPLITQDIFLILNNEVS